MERVAAFWDQVMGWWANVPPIPSLDLPPPPDPILLTAIATCVLAAAIMGVLTGWVEGRLSWISFLALLLGLALFYWVWNADRAAFGLLSIPEAFIELVARILR